MSNVPPQLPPAPAPVPGGPTAFDPADIRRQIADGTVILPIAEQEVLVAYANAVRLRLGDFEAAIRDRDAWRAPAGLAFGFLSSLITIVGTKDFGGLFGVNRDVCIGAFGAAFLLSVVWMAIAAARAWSRRKGNTVEDVVRSLPRADAAP